MTSYYDQNLKLVVNTQQLAQLDYPLAVVELALAGDQQQLAKSGLYKLVTPLALIHKLLFTSYSYNYLIDTEQGTCSCSYELQLLTLEKAKQSLLNYLQKCTDKVESETFGAHPLLTLATLVSEGNLDALTAAVSYHRWLSLVEDTIHKATDLQQLIELVIEQEPAFIRYYPHVT